MSNLIENFNNITFIFENLLPTLRKPELIVLSGGYYPVPTLEQMEYYYDIHLEGLKEEHSWIIPGEGNFKSFSSFNEFIQRNKQHFLLDYSRLLTHPEFTDSIFTPLIAECASIFSELNYASEALEIFHDEEFIENKARIMNNRMHWELIPVEDLIPYRYFAMNGGDKWMFSRSATNIREIFSYSANKVPDLTKAGFILSENEYCRFLVFDNVTKQQWHSKILNIKNIKYNKTSHVFGLKSTCRKRFISKQYRVEMYVGVDLKVNKEAISILNEEYRVKYSLSHSKPHVKHKEHLFKNENKRAKIFLDESGLEVTLKQYSEKHNIHINTARKRLTDLNCATLEATNQRSHHAALRTSSQPTVRKITDQNEQDAQSPCHRPKVKDQSAIQIYA